MTAFRTLLACSIVAGSAVQAQDIAPKDGERNPLFSALSSDFSDSDTPSVSIDITATAPSLFPEDLDDTETEVVEKMEEEVPEIPEPEGVTVTVEPGQGDHGKVDAKSVKLLAPFPAKPLFMPPAGWKLEHPDSVPTFVREVPLGNGTNISLSIRPHLLVPDADGDQVIAVNEPGYDSALRYAQTGTMAAVLSTSVERMEEDSIQMTAALDRLSQLLSSLPSSDTAATNIKSK